MGGAKLQELLSGLRLLEGVPEGSAFLDLCGGPGEWSQLLLAQKPALRGFGLTLRGTPDSEDEEGAVLHSDGHRRGWHRELNERSDWSALWGADDTGDLLKPG